MEIGVLLKQAVEQKASDLHLTAGMPPTIRSNGLLIRLTNVTLKPENTRSMAEQLFDQRRLTAFKKEGELGYAHSYPGVGRFRVNVFYQRGTIGLAIRIIQAEIPTIGSLGLPDIVLKMAQRPSGLILITGPAGSGKTATLAAMINYINENRQCHIITLEDPIEYLHSHKNCIINQREIGSDSRSFPSALRAALYQDPDVIMVGEMRDLETVSAAVTAAETGKLILASVHTLNAHQTIRHIINVFPADRKEQIRVQLADTLVGIISQRLIPRKDGKGRVAAVEFLAATPAINNLILEGKIKQINTTMQTGAKAGMRTMDNHLRYLYQKGMISAENALKNAADHFSVSRYIYEKSPLK